jgi:hypothetical protein
MSVLKATPAVLILSVFAAGLGCATIQSNREAKARLSETYAAKVALARVPSGIIKESELEREHEKLVWSFDIETPGRTDITEVQVDAATGEIVSVEKETAAQQDAEKRKDERLKK